jgi:hypothetical protein
LGQACASGCQNAKDNQKTDFEILTHFENSTCKFQEVSEVLQFPFQTKRIKTKGERELLEPVQSGFETTQSAIGQCEPAAHEAFTWPAAPLNGTG